VKKVEETKEENVTEKKNLNKVDIDMVNERFIEGRGGYFLKG
jgi:hypothetical protein